MLFKQRLDVTQKISLRKFNLVLIHPNTFLLTVFESVFAVADNNQVCRSNGCNSVDI